MPFLLIAIAQYAWPLSQGSEQYQRNEPTFVAVTACRVLREPRRAGELGRGNQSRANTAEKASASEASLENQTSVIFPSRRR